MLRTTATKYGLKTLADLKKVPDLTLAGFPEFQTRWIPQLSRLYGVKNVEFMPLASICAYTLLDPARRCWPPTMFTTDPQLISTKYVAAAEPRNMFGFQHVAPVLRKKLRDRERRRFTSTVNKVSALLTRAGDDRDEQGGRVDKKPASAVAKAFLKANS